MKIDNDGYLAVRSGGLRSSEHGADHSTSNALFVELQEDQVTIHNGFDIFRTIFPSAKYRHYHLLVPALQLGSYRPWHS